MDAGLKVGKGGLGPTLAGFIQKTPVTDVSRGKKLLESTNCKVDCTN